MPNLHPIPTDTSIEGRSHINRYINHFWVNGQGGGNVGPYGGGGVVCCQSISGDTAEVEWVYGRIVEEFERGDEPERHSVTLPMPERSGKTVTCMCTFCPITKSSWAGVKT